MFPWETWSEFGLAVSVSLEFSDLWTNKADRVDSFEVLALVLVYNPIPRISRLIQLHDESCRPYHNPQMRQQCALGTSWRMSHQLAGFNPLFKSQTHTSTQRCNRHLLAPGHSLRLSKVPGSKAHSCEQLICSLAQARSVVQVLWNTRCGFSIQRRLNLGLVWHCSKRATYTAVLGTFVWVTVARNLILSTLVVCKLQFCVPQAYQSVRFGSVLKRNLKWLFSGV